MDARCEVKFKMQYVAPQWSVTYTSVEDLQVIFGIYDSESEAKEDASRIERDNVRVFEAYEHRGES